MMLLMLYTLISESWLEQEITQRQAPLKETLEAKLTRILGKNPGKH